MPGVEAKHLKITLPGAICLSLILTASVWLIFLRQKAGSNGLLLQNPVINLGEILQWQSKETRFILRNTGRETITIRSIKTSCACTQTQVLNATLHPNEQTDLVVRINTQGRIGKFSARVTVEWNALSKSGSGNLAAVVNATAVRLGELIPARLDLGSVDVNSSQVDSIIEVKPGESHMQWSKAEAYSDRGGSLKVDKRGEIWRISYKFAPFNQIAGPANDEIHVRFVDAFGRVQGIENVPVEATLTSKIKVYPHAIFLPAVKVGNIIHGTVNIWADDSSKLTLKEIKCADSRLVSFQKSEQKPGSVQIGYKFFAPYQEGPVSSFIDIDVVSETPKKLLIPVTAFVRK